MAETSDYAFGLILGLLMLSIWVLLNLDHPREIVQKPSPPPSPPLTPRDPDLPIEPYDEEAIAASMATIYKLLIDLNYLKENEIIYPPPGGHTINLELCQSLKLDQRVVSLMQQLPCPRDLETSFDLDIIGETRGPVYVDDDDVRDGRDPENAGTGVLRLDYLLPTDIALTIGKRYGKSLILDTQANTIKIIEFDFPTPRDDMEKPDDPSHYRNYPTEPALEVLRRYAHEYRSLASIPRRYREPLSRWNRTKHPELKRILTDEYGWPNGFRKDAWAQDYERIWYEVDHRFEAAENSKW